MIGFPLSAICSKSPMEMDKSNLNLKDEVPLNCKKYPAVKHFTDIYRLVLLLTHLVFRWTVHLRDFREYSWFRGAKLHEEAILTALQHQEDSVWLPDGPSWHKICEPVVDPSRLILGCPAKHFFCFGSTETSSCFGYVLVCFVKL